jgi:FkbM family methyltransferase
VKGSDAGHARTPLRWQLAGLVRRYVPDRRGRDRLCSFIVGNSPIPQGTYRGMYGTGIRFSVDFSRDSSLTDLFWVQYEDPSLAPVLGAFLKPGACFYDVGANIGIYSLWASTLVGPRGEVHSFEPVPSTREMLQASVDENDLANVVIVPHAVSDGTHKVAMQAVLGASGLSSVVREFGDHPGQRIEVTAITLDEYSKDCRLPDLIKIDVEGYELEVVRGMIEILSSVKPPVVFEASPKTASEWERTKEVRTLFDQFGYSLFDLTPRGLRPSNEERPSLNVLAADAQLHEKALGRLHDVRFRRNQNL